MGRETTTQVNDLNPPAIIESSPRKRGGVGVGDGGGGGGGGDRLKRDEWSEGAVTILLEAYESKWILRNRAKLKGQDWEDIAKCVSFRANNSRLPKTQTQCKNKIESMKKKYRSESAIGDTSSWPLFSRLDQLLRGTGGSSHGSLSAQLPGVKSPLPHSASLPPQSSPFLELSPVSLPPLPSHPSPVLESSPVAHPTLPPQQPPDVVAQHYSLESNDVVPMVKKNDEIATKSSDKLSEKDVHDDHHLETETDSSTSTPALYSNDKDGLINQNKMTVTRKRRRRGSGNGSGWEEVAESIRWAADAVLRSVQARTETMREVERMRVEAEAKRMELEVKRTEIIANTQLEIAKIFASVVGKNVDSH